LTIPAAGATISLEQHCGYHLQRHSFHCIISSQENMTMETRTRDLEFNVVIEKDEDGYYVASVPALRGCHTQAKSLDVLMKRVREAIELCLEVESPVVNEFIGVQRVVVAA
jgi:predicted RNase H-like HicB family nuclease